MKVSPTVGEFYSTSHEYSASEGHHIYSSRVILPEQTYVTSHVPFSTPVPSPHIVPEENPVLPDTAINVTQTSMSLSFNQVQSVPLEPYSTVKTSFLPEQFYRDIHVHNESVSLSDFTLSIHSSKVYVESSITSLHSSTAIAFTSHKGPESFNPDKGKVSAYFFSHFYFKEKMSMPVASFLILLAKKLFFQTAFRIAIFCLFA